MDKKTAKYLYEKWSTCKRIDCPHDISKDYTSATICIVCKQYTTKRKYYTKWWEE